MKPKSNWSRSQDEKVDQRYSEAETDLLAFQPVLADEVPPGNQATEKSSSTDHVYLIQTDSQFVISMRAPLRLFLLARLTWLLARLSVVLELWVDSTASIGVQAGQLRAATSKYIFNRRFLAN
jgi:hypothetical protein